MGTGYKQQCIDSGALAMWSFDGDIYDRNTLVPLTNEIIDDVTGECPGFIVSEYPSLQHLYIGGAGLVALEQSLQSSCSIGRNDGPFSIPTQFPKNYVEVPFVDRLNLATNRGSFTVEFLYKKYYDQGANTVWGGWWWNYWQRYSPLIRKRNVFSIYTYQQQHDPTNQNRLEFRGPLGTLSAYNINYPGIIGGTVHVVCSYGITPSGDGVFYARQELFINGQSAGVLTRTYEDDTFNTYGTNDPIEIGGWSNNEITDSINGFQYNDRQTSTCVFDQVTLYNRAMTSSEVISHFKKTCSYDSFIRYQRPAIYTSFQQAIASVDSTNQVDFVTSEVGGRNPWVLGTYQLGSSGPPILPNSVALEMAADSFVYYRTLDGNGRMISPMGAFTDYTFDFFFKSPNAKPGTLVCMQYFNNGFPGFNLELNRNENGERDVGTIVYTERRGVQVSATGAFSDNEWHHVAIRRWGSALDIFVDGDFWDRSTSSWGGISATANPCQLFLFAGGHGNTYAGPGSIAHFAFYNRALPLAEIEARSLYSNAYEIKGVVTLQGNPFGATIRFYNHRTGELVQEVMSDNATGEYRAVFGASYDIDILVMDKYDPNVRYRAYGPITPSSFDDYPITI